MRKDNIKNITLVALFMALVVIGSRIYIGTHDTFRFHLGNSMCLLASFILTPFYGGLAAGVGSMVFDIMFYPSGLMCIITLITKFIMSYVASICFYKVFNNARLNIRIIISGAIGELVYIILYGLKTYIERRYALGMDIKAVMLVLWPKIITSAINAVIAIIISLVLYKLIEKVINPKK